METKVKRREWVKTAAIVFLSVLLVLTFFSNTIMNHSLPEVAAQYVESGTINARIRGTGTVSANEVYNVTLSQTRKVNSVLVKVGQEVVVGDPLVRLESRESEELKAAQDALDQMELSYQKSLIEASNSTSSEDREIQKLREDYDEAVRIYRIYSNVNPEHIAVALHEAESDLSRLQSDKARIDADLLMTQNELAKAQEKEANYLARLGDLETQIDKLHLKIDGIDSALAVFNADLRTYREDYNKLETISKTHSDPALQMRYFAENKSALIAAGISEVDAERQVKAYDVLYTDLAALTECFDKTVSLDGVTDLDTIYTAVSDTAKSEKTIAEQNLLLVESEIDEINRSLSVNNPNSSAALEEAVEDLQKSADRFASAIAEQQNLVSNYSEASSAAATLKSAEEALEDALFQASLGDSANLDMQAAKEAIDEQKKLVEELTVEADGQEITASVTGTVTAINVSAGVTAAAEQPIVEITVADRGYTVPISVTAEQARQVRVGDTAEITNYYWGDITATLENIASDPQSMGKNKMLIFRIEGEGVEAGTNLTLSIGQRSANYDCLVPNSAIRSDSNGSFVLVVEAKSSPLGNRYIATRADVQVLASDDTTSAVSGLANGDFVITTSSKPLEAGESVRLPDNG